MKNSRAISLLVAGATIPAIVTGCGGSTPAAAPSTVTVAPSTVTVAAPNTVTVAAPAPAAPATQVAEAPAAPVLSGITIPDLPAGTNAEIVRDKLQDLGLTNVDLASANPDYTNVFLPKNWTLVSIEPSPGTVVQASDPVIVKVTKP